MLDVTTNQAGTNINYGPYCGVGAGLGGIMNEATELLLDEEMMMDPLFDEDWLHENNLDILFDLFEEEIESKISGDSSNSSSAVFGTSPVTSYLFGTSPSLASALDLIYFDNQQQQHQQQPTAQTNAGANHVPSSSTNALASSATTIKTASAASSPNQSTLAAKTITSINSSAPNDHATTSSKTSGAYNVINGTKVPHRANTSGAQQVIQSNNNPTLNSAKNAMRIKRGMKKGHCEGTSLLAKPGLGNSSVSKTNGNGSSSSDINSSNSNKSASKMNSSSRKTNGLSSKNISDKTSVKVTNFKNSIIIGNATSHVNDRNGIDIKYSKQQQNRERYYLSKCQQHVHYITGRAVIREHAYAVRGH